MIQDVIEFWKNLTRGNFFCIFAPGFDTSGCQAIVNQLLTIKTFFIMKEETFENMIGGTRCPGQQAEQEARLHENEQTPGLQSNEQAASQLSNEQEASLLSDQQGQPAESPAGSNPAG